jgi:glycerophosphoryl diester phosphodiesterase
MDSVFTSDGVPVIWHDVSLPANQPHLYNINTDNQHNIIGTKCKGDYVGQYIANLTLAQVKTLDCGLQLADFPQAKGQCDSLFRRTS